MHWKENFAVAYNVMRTCAPIYGHAIIYIEQWAQKFEKTLPKMHSLGIKCKSDGKTAAGWRTSTAGKCAQAHTHERARHTDLFHSTQSTRCECTFLPSYFRLISFVPFQCYCNRVLDLPAKISECLCVWCAVCNAKLFSSHFSTSICFSISFGAFISFNYFIFTVSGWWWRIAKRSSILKTVNIRPFY